MGWNDRMEEGNELGNLPAEAFSSWHVDGEFEPDEQWLRTAGKGHKTIAIRAWFLDRYCDPVHNTAYSSKEGGCQFMHGGPYDPAEILHNRFAGAVEDDVIQGVVDELHQEVGDEWAPVQRSYADDYDDDYGVDIENGDQPLERLRERLVQSKQILTLQGDSSARALARNLSFGSVITSLESFLWETVSYWVDHDEAAITNIVTKIPRFRDQPLKLGQIFEKRETLKNDIKAYLQNLVWHQWDKVVPLFRLGLETDMPSLKQFDDALIKRHDIVHRSGFTKEREPIEVTVAEIEALCEQIAGFAADIQEKLGSRAARLAFGTNAS